MQQAAESHTDQHRPGRTRLLVLLLTLIGLAQVLLCRPYWMNDERGYFLHAYAISCGDVAGTAQGGLSGHMVPSVLAQDTLLFREPSLSPRAWQDQFYASHHWTTRKLADKQFVQCPYPVSPLLPYLPTAAIMAVGRAIGSRGITILYLARLVDLTILCAGAYWAFRLLQSRPWAQFLCFAVATAPAILCLHGTISPIPVTLAIALPAIALAVRLPSAPTRRDLIAFAALGALLSLSVSLLLLIPLGCFAACIVAARRRHAEPLPDGAGRPLR